jgi:hypothetical protein
VADLTLKEMHCYTGCVYLSPSSLVLLPRYLQVLTTGSELASFIGETELSEAYATNASSLKTAFNDAFWDDDAGLYNDNLTTTLRPQDANSFAVLYNLTESDEQKTRISEGLTQNWNDIGAVAPELPDTISPFIGSFEVSDALLYLHALLILTSYRSKHTSSQSSPLEHLI